MVEDQVPPDEPRKPNLNQRDGSQQRSAAGLKIASAFAVLIAVIAAGYAWLQYAGARQLASERVGLRASLAQATGKADTLTAKVDALSAALAEEHAARAHAETTEKADQESVQNGQFLPRSSEPFPHTSHANLARRASADDARWKQIQNQLGDQQKALAESQKQIAESQQQIADTKNNLEQAKSALDGNLQSARNDLDGNIARTHDELVSLEKKGERTYYEFNFEKSKGFHHTGPIGLALRKADAKHAYCDLQMVVDDKEIPRKHINLYESITLYPAGYPRPLELVINHIDKDSVQGYVSEPKYQSRDLSTPPPAASPGSASASVNSPVPTVPESQIEHRGEAH